MAFDLEKTITDMLGAVQGVVADEWPRVQGDMERVLADEREALNDIAQARLNGDIDDEELVEQLADEKEAFTAGLAMVRATSKAAVQKAVDAATSVFFNAVRAAL